MLLIYICIYRLATEIPIDLRILAKVLKTCQKNSLKLDNIVKKQEELEAMINDQNDKINEILSKLQDNAAVESVESKGKEGKGKGKRNKNEFYQVNICFIIIYFVYAVFIFILIINFICIL